eukprot:163951_1
MSLQEVCDMSWSEIAERTLECLGNDSLNGDLFVEQALYNATHSENPPHLINKLLQFLTIDDFNLLIDQVIPSSYTTARKLKSKYWQYNHKKNKLLDIHCKIYTFPYSMRIVMSEQEINKESIVGKPCAYYMEGHGYVDGVILSIDPHSMHKKYPKHVVSIHSQPPKQVTISAKGAVKSSRLHIFKRTDTSRAISIKTWWYILELMPNILKKATTENIDTTFEISTFGQRKDLWIGYKYRVIIPTLTKQPHIISIGSCLELEDGNVIVIVNIKGDTIKYCETANFADLRTIISKSIRFNIYEDALCQSKEYLDFQKYNQYDTVRVLMHEMHTIKLQHLMIRRVVTFGDLNHQNCDYIIFGFVCESHDHAGSKICKRQWQSVVKLYRDKFGGVSNQKNTKWYALSGWQDGARIFEFKTKSSEDVLLFKIVNKVPNFILRNEASSFPIASWNPKAYKLDVLSFINDLCKQAQKGFIEDINGIKTTHRFAFCAWTGDSQQSHVYGRRKKLNVAGPSPCFKCNADQFELTNYKSKTSFTQPTSSQERIQLSKDNNKTFEAFRAEYGYDPVSRNDVELDKAAVDPLTGWVLDCHHLAKNVGSQEFEYIQCQCITDTNNRTTFNAHLMDYYSLNNLKNPFTVSNLSKNGKKVVDWSMECAMRIFNEHINYYCLAQFWMQNIAEIGIVVYQSDEKDLAEGKWKHTHILRTYGFHRHTAHHTMHAIEQIELYGNLYIYGTKTNETHNKHIRHGAKHRSPKETYSQAIARHHILFTTMLYLTLGGTFSANGEMCRDGPTKIPRQWVTSQNTHFDQWNSFSTFVELQQHPDNPRFTDGHKATRGTSRQNELHVDDVYELYFHNVSFGDCMPFNLCMQSAPHHENVNSVRQLRSVTYWRRRKEFESKVNNLVLLSDNRILAILLIVLYGGIPFVIGMEVKLSGQYAVDKNDNIKHLKVGVVCSEPIICVTISSVKHPLYYYHNCDESCVAKVVAESDKLSIAHHWNNREKNEYEDFEIEDDSDNKSNSDIESDVAMKDVVFNRRCYPKNAVYNHHYIELFILPFIGNGFELFYDILMDFHECRDHIMKSKS